MTFKSNHHLIATFSSAAACFLDNSPSHTCTLSYMYLPHLESTLAAAPSILLARTPLKITPPQIYMYASLLAVVFSGRRPFLHLEEKRSCRSSSKLACFEGHSPTKAELWLLYFNRKMSNPGESNPGRCNIVEKRRGGSFLRPQRRIPHVQVPTTVLRSSKSKRKTHVQSGNRTRVAATTMQNTNHCTN